MVFVGLAYLTGNCFGLLKPVIRVECHHWYSPLFALIVSLAPFTIWFISVLLFVTRLTTCAARILNWDLLVFSSLNILIINILVFSLEIVEHNPVTVIYLLGYKENLPVCQASKSLTSEDWILCNFSLNRLLKDQLTENLFKLWLIHSYGISRWYIVA